MKPTVYVETTVIGHLVGRPLEDPVVAGRQTVTREWWTTARTIYRLFASRLVADECGAGDSEAAAERLAVLDSVEFIAMISRKSGKILSRIREFTGVASLAI